MRPSPLQNRPAQILLVEDNPFDVLMITSGLEEANASYHLHVVHDGEEAISYLRRSCDPKQKVARPDLILLDLNLPRLDGREVLAEIKSDPSLKLIPVIILTTSSDSEDVVKAYDLNVNCFITKPIDIEQFSATVQSIAGFWLTRVLLPRSAS